MTVATILTQAAPTVLKAGNRSPEVVDLQYLLSWLFVIDVDGDFGPQTLRIVKIFQQVRGLERDGIVGPQTWSALAPAQEWPTAEPGVFLRQGDLGAEKLQAKLRSRGLYHGRIDGEFGPLTYAAVLEVQKETTHTNTAGIVGPNTFLAITGPGRLQGM